MEYLPVTARFLFSNGANRYTVEYCFGVSKWYVFYGEDSCNCLYSTKDSKTAYKDINKNSANEVLNKYLNI